MCRAPRTPERPRRVLCCSWSEAGSVCVVCGDNGYAYLFEGGQAVSRVKVCAGALGFASLEPHGDIFLGGFGNHTLYLGSMRGLWESIGEQRRERRSQPASATRRGPGARRTAPDQVPTRGAPRQWRGRAEGVGGGGAGHGVGTGVGAQPSPAQGAGATGRCSHWCECGEGRGVMERAPGRRRPRGQRQSGRRSGAGHAVVAGHGGGRWRAAPHPPRSLLVLLWLLASQSSRVALLALLPSPSSPRPHSPSWPPRPHGHPLLDLDSRTTRVVSVRAEHRIPADFDLTWPSHCQLGPRWARSARPRQT